jgi:hypothetical protein
MSEPVSVVEEVAEPAPKVEEPAPEPIDVAEEPAPEKPATEHEASGEPQPAVEPKTETAAVSEPPAAAADDAATPTAVSEPEPEPEPESAVVAVVESETPKKVVDPVQQLMVKDKEKQALLMQVKQLEQLKGQGVYGEVDIKVIGRVAGVEAMSVKQMFCLESSSGMLTQMEKTEEGFRGKPVVTGQTGTMQVIVELERTAPVAKEDAAEEDEVTKEVVEREAAVDGEVAEEEVASAEKEEAKPASQVIMRFPLAIEEVPVDGPSLETVVVCVPTEGGEGKGASVSVVVSMVSLPAILKEKMVALEQCQMELQELNRKVGGAAKAAKAAPLIKNSKKSVKPGFLNKKKTPKAKVAAAPSLYARAAYGLQVGVAYAMEYRAASLFVACSAYIFMKGDDLSV